MAATSRTFTFRLAETFANELETKAKSEHMSPGAWVRELVLHSLNDKRTDEPSNEEILAAQRTMNDKLDDLGRTVENIVEAVSEMDDRRAGATCSVAHAVKPAADKLTTLTRMNGQHVEADREELRSVASKLDDLATSIEQLLGDGHIKVPNGTATIRHQLNLLRWDVVNAVILLLADAGKMEFDDAVNYVTEKLEVEGG